MARGVFKSTDGGASWNAVNNGLTTTYIAALALDRSTSPATVYAGWSFGVFKSTNGGTSWSAVNNGLGVYALAVDQTTNPATVYAGTGLGVFAAQDVCGRLPQTWTPRRLQVDETLSAVAFGADRYVAVSRGGYILTSFTGVGWTMRERLALALEGIAYGAGRFVAVGSTGSILSSADGIEWGAHLSGTLSTLRSVAFGNGRFVTVGDLGTVRTSPNGTSWDSFTSGTFQDLLSVAYGNNRFVAVGAAGTIRTSSDGSTWTSATSGTNETLRAVTHGAGRFVAVGDSGTLLISSDGVTWETRASATDRTLNGVAFGPEGFVAVGAGGVIVSSGDGLTWREETSNSERDLLGATAGPDRVIVVGAVTILDSGDTPPKRPLIFIPGIYGSFIHGTLGEQYWPIGDNCSLRDLALPEDGIAPPGSFPCTARLQRWGEPADWHSASCPAVIETWEVHAKPRHLGCYLYAGQQYRALLEYLAQEFGDTHDIYTFGYDWRLNIADIAVELGAQVESLLADPEGDRIDIIAHSLGGLVAKAWLTGGSTAVDREARERKVRRIAFLGTPHFGAPKAIVGLVEGPDDYLKFLVLVGLSPAALADVARNMPSAYHLLPTARFALAARDAPLQIDGVPVTGRRVGERLLEHSRAADWCDCVECSADSCEQQAQRLNQRLIQWLLPEQSENWSPSASSGLEAYLLYGVGQPIFINNTIAQVRLKTEPGPTGTTEMSLRWFQGWTRGDTTVPAASASAQGLNPFDGRRFEFAGAKHGPMGDHVGVRACVRGLLLEPTADLSNCPQPSGSGARSTRVVGAEEAVEVDVSGGSARLRLTDAEGNVTGHSEDGFVEESVPGSQFFDYRSVQIALLPIDAAVTMEIEAQEGGPLEVCLRPMREGRPAREFVYEVALEAGGRATGELSEISATLPIEVDADGDGISDEEVMPVQLPVANAGGHQVVTAGTRVVLDGSASTTVGELPLTYLWAQIDGSPVTLSDATSSTPSFTAPEVAAETPLAFSLRVKAGEVESFPDAASVLVLATVTFTPSPTPSQTATTDTPAPTLPPPPTPCAGDCNVDREVRVNELITMVNIALATAQLSACQAGDQDGNGAIAINEIIMAVNNTLTGCPVVSAMAGSGTADGGGRVSPDPSDAAGRPWRWCQYRTWAKRENDREEEERR